MTKIKDLVAKNVTYAIIIYSFFHYIIKFFTSNLWGVLIFTILLYFSVPIFSDIQPFGFKQLLDWFIELPETYKTAISSSLLTIIGFLVAFQVASSRVFTQQKNQIKLDAAKEIFATYHNAINLVGEVKFFAKRVLTTIDDIAKSKNPDFSIALIWTLYNDSLKLQETINQIHEMHSALFTIQGRTSHLLINIIGTHIQLNRATSDFGNIYIACAGISIPYIGPDNFEDIEQDTQKFIDHFCNHVRYEIYKDMENNCIDAIESLSAILVEAPAYLEKTLVDTRLSGLFSLITNRDNLRSHIRKRLGK